MQDLSAVRNQPSKFACLLLVSLKCMCQLENEGDLLDLIRLIGAWALESEQLFREPVPILIQGQSETVRLTRRQVRSLLSLMFWCLMPKQNRQDRLPKDYTFSRLYGTCKGREAQQFNKLLCVVNYFKRAQTADDTLITFFRGVLDSRKNWTAEDAPLLPLSIEDTPRSIEEYPDYLMVDFADPSIGGGVLGLGCVQEEILFLVHVEPIVSMLFTELLIESEALTIVGAMRFNLVTGYSKTFEWVGNMQDRPRLDSEGRYDRHIVAIDAVNFTGRERIQFHPRQIQRELNKALIGFLGDPKETGKRMVATGRWGCGAFSGNDHLKFLIQWCAASATGRPLHYISWEPELISGMSEVSASLTSKRVSEVVQVLFRMPEAVGPSVFGYVLKALAS